MLRNLLQTLQLPYNPARPDAESKGEEIELSQPMSDTPMEFPSLERPTLELAAENVGCLLLCTAQGGVPRH